jgi:hypothetical protein
MSTATRCIFCIPGQGYRVGIRLSTWGCIMADFRRYTELIQADNPPVSSQQALLRCPGICTPEAEYRKIHFHTCSRLSPIHIHPISSPIKIFQLTKPVPTGCCTDFIASSYLRMGQKDVLPRLGFSALAGYRHAPFNGHNFGDQKLVWFDALSARLAKTPDPSS